MGLFDSIGSLFGSDSILGVQAWTSPNLVRVQDGTPSNALLLLGIQSQYLKVQQFGFQVPMDAVVTGIKVAVVRWSSVNLGTQDSSIRLYKAGTLTGNDYAQPGTIYWSNTAETVTYGSDTDIWGWDAMTPVDINSPSFGVGIAAKAALAGTASIDYVNITVYYRGSNGLFGSSEQFRADSGISVSGTVN